VEINSNAPVISRHEITISAPLESVWQVHTEIDRWTQWNPGHREGAPIRRFSVAFVAQGSRRTGSQPAWKIEAKLGGAFTPGTSQENPRSRLKSDLWIARDWVLTDEIKRGLPHRVRLPKSRA